VAPAAFDVGVASNLNNFDAEQCCIIALQEAMDQRSKTSGLHDGDWFLAYSRRLLTVQQSARVNTKGMQKISAFFGVRKK
jgi:hypothetical protein